MKLILITILLVSISGFIMSIVLGNYICATLNKITAKLCEKKNILDDLTDDPEYRFYYRLDKILDTMCTWSIFIYLITNLIIAGIYVFT